MKNLNVKNEIYFESNDYDHFLKNIDKKNITPSRKKQLVSVSERFKKAIDRYGEVKINIDKRNTKYDA